MEKKDRDPLDEEDLDRTISCPSSQGEAKEDTDRTISCPSSQSETKEESDPSTSDMISPLSREVFSQLFDEATVDVMSSDGELTEIANRELMRIKTEPETASVDLLKEAVTEAFRCSPAPLFRKPTSPTPVKVATTPSSVSATPSPCPITDSHTPSSVGGVGILRNWAGNYKFDIILPTFKRPKDPHYSKKVDKLYIGQNKNITIQLCLDTSSLTSTQTLSLRSEMVFTSADHQGQVVQVCWQHSRNSQGELRDPLASHILRVSCEGRESKYIEFIDSKRRAIVISPLPKPDPGSGKVLITLRLTDLGSCPGGINRRDTAVVFSLEQEGGVVVGRKVLPVRVCTCPRRDMLHDENGEVVGPNSLSQGGQPGRRGVKRKAAPGAGQTEVFYVPVYGRENFEALCQVGKVLEKHRPGGDVVEWGRQVELSNSSA